MEDKLTKLVKKLDPTYVEDVNKMDVAALRSELVKVQQEIARNQETQDNDDKLAAARAAVRDYSEGYRDVKKLTGAKNKYLLHKLREQEILTGVKADAAASADGSTEIPAIPAAAN